MDDLFTCVVCNENYSETTRLPRNLPCGHTYCSACLRQVIETSHHCPECRQHIPNVAVTDLPVCYAITRVLGSSPENQNAVEIPYFPSGSARIPTPFTQSSPLYWHPANNGIPVADPVIAFVKGHQRAEVAAAKHRGGLIPGVVYTNERVCRIPWGCGEVIRQEYYVLCNPGGVKLKWVSSSNGNTPPNAIQAGYVENSSEPLYVGRCYINGEIFCGKVHPSHRVCYVPICGQERNNSEYDVLCVDQVPLTFLGMRQS